MEYFTLKNGVSMPAIGFGTYKATDGDDRAVLDAARRAGYRHFDTAAFYGNEAEVGAALAASGLPRSDLFVTTKVWREDLGYDAALRSFEASSQRLGLEVIDLLLIHWPTRTPGDPDSPALCRETWRALEALYRAGRVRAIGVSNFLPHHLMHLMETAEIAPMVDQLEFHPGYPQLAALQFCQAHDIRVTAWSPLGRARMLTDPTLTEMAARYGKSPAQLCLRFALDCGVCPLPKSVSPDRIAQNLAVFDFHLSPEDLSRLACLPQIGWSGEHPDRPRLPV